MSEVEIRTLLTPLSSGHILVPNSVVAEILEYSSPEPFTKAPVWLLGELEWHGWQVPVVSFLKLINKGSQDTVTKKSRILIIKTLGESTQLNYIGLLIQGLPRIKSVSAETLIENRQQVKSKVVFSEVKVDETTALIPELALLTQIIERTAYGK
jgi:chemosensory pili system protein ChpC